MDRDNNSQFKPRYVGIGFTVGPATHAAVRAWVEEEGRKRRQAIEEALSKRMFPARERSDVDDVTRG